VQRAKYLLELNGVDVAFETNTSMPSDFLMRQLELREALELAAAERDVGALDRLRAGLRVERRALEAELAERIDAARDYSAAAGPTRKLMFLGKLDAEIDAAHTELEA
jgi:molecular chaperone HscB